MILGEEGAQKRMTILDPKFDFKIGRVWALRKKMREKLISNWSHLLSQTQQV